MDLPEEVMMEILMRLPVKSLLKIRCVCKAWCGLIKSPSFIDMHLRRPGNNKHVMLKRYIEHENQTVISFHSNNDEAEKSLSICLRPPIEVTWFYHRNLEAAHLIGPCNGIVCITDGMDIYLCNPATRELRKLPPSPFGCPENYRPMTDGVGIGFDPSTNDYKVVRILYWEAIEYRPDRQYQAELYSLNTNSWRELRDVILPFYHCFSRCNLLFQGRFHWRAWHAFAQPCDTDCILSFDMRAEVFDVIHYPPSCVGDLGLVENKEPSFVSLNDSLALILCTSLSEEHPAPPQVIDIWVMMEYGVEESWTKKFSLGPFTTGIRRPLCLWKDDKQLLLESRSGRLISCSLLPDELEAAELKEHDIFESSTLLEGRIYAESLVSLNPIYMEEEAIIE
nr:F-box protein CPR1-like [Coffea arabica]